MPNLASILKQEIARIARREVRAEVDALRKASTRHRAEIAALKREVTALHKLQRKTSRASTTPSGTQASVPRPALRFRSGGLAAHRNRLGLSAEDLGKLIGVSGQSIYSWESGKSRPRASYMPAIAALRKLGRKQARKVLAARG